MSTFQDRVSTEAPQSKRDIARERRREAIIQKAAALFYRYGYGSTTMTMVANAVGGSKGTLWSYFGTKELLLTAVVDGASAEFHDAIRSAFRPSDDVRNSTIDLCRIATERMLEPDISGLFRIVVTEGQNHREIKTIFYDRGPRFVRLCLTEYLTCAIGPTESERIAPQILSLVMGYRLRCIFEPE